VLFVAGEQGAWYDPSDLSTLFQDAAGTTPVTALGQPVGLMLDKSGNGNHASQATSTARPTLGQDANGKRYLKFDGVDDFLVTPSIDFTGTDKMFVAAGVYSDNLTSGVIGMVANHNGTGTKSFALQVPTGNTNQITFYVLGNTTGSGATENGVTNPMRAVLTGMADLAAPSRNLRRNGIVKSQTVAETGGGPFANSPLTIGAQSGGTMRFFKGDLHSLIVRGAQSTEAQIAAAERWVNSKTGAY